MILNTVIYSAGEDLDTVLAEQETLITDIKTTLEGKAAATSQSATLTVTVKSSGYRFIAVDINGDVYNTRTAGIYTLTVPVPCLAGFKGYSFTGSYELVQSTADVSDMDLYLITGDTTAVSASGVSEPEP